MQALGRATLTGIVLLSAAAAQADPVTFIIDPTAQVKPISRFIYGINDTLGGTHANLTARREGGNRWTAYNWVNNASNAGRDFLYQNDNYLGGGNTPGGAVIPAIVNARQNNAALLLTIPIQGYVAADKNPPGDVRNSGDDYLQTRFHRERAVKGSEFTLTPSPATPFVYQDEFVNWVKTKYPGTQNSSTRPIWFSLDNEPDLWQETHLEVHPDPPTYAELVSKGAAYAKGIKAVAPNTLVFGPVSYGFAGYVNLQGAPDANGRDFLSFYLKQMKARGDAADKRLLDVLDLHWYPEARDKPEAQGGIRITENNTSPAVVAARLQAPRSLWDANYREVSWIADDYYDGPIYLLPRMFKKIAQNYPDTKLAFTEYNYGAGAHISGGIAQADVLGIFGKYGVFAAMQWPLMDAPETFVAGAFKMYRDFDGANGTFGDTSIKAVTSSIADTSVYASVDSANAGRMVIIAINKTGAPIDAAISLRHAPAMMSAKVYQLTSASALPQAISDIPIPNGRSFSYTMPAYSVNTLELTTN
jgi:hypothetical protein